MIQLITLHVRDPIKQRSLYQIPKEDLLDVNCNYHDELKDFWEAVWINVWIIRKRKKSHEWNHKAINRNKPNKTCLWPFDIFCMKFLLCYILGLTIQVLQYRLYKISWQCKFYYARFTIQVLQYKFYITSSTIQVWQYKFDNTSFTMQVLHYKFNNTSFTIQVLQYKFYNTNLTK
jgi:hypothetical protein